MIRTGNLYDTWLNVLKEVYEKGDEVLDERGSETLELTNIISSFPNPFINGLNSTEVIPEYHNYWNGEKLDKYVKQFNSPKNDGFQYTYGLRIRSYLTNHIEREDQFTSDSKIPNPIIKRGYMNQVKEVIYKLRSNIHTRRAEIITWDVYKDNKNEDVPCLMMVDYKIRNGKLQTTAIWRSHDIYGAFYPNMIGLAFQTKEIAYELGVEIGDFTIQSISAHIYKTDIDEVKKCLK